MIAKISICSSGALESSSPPLVRSRGRREDSAGESKGRGRRSGVGQNRCASIQCPVSAEWVAILSLFREIGGRCLFVEVDSAPEMRMPAAASQVQKANYQRFMRVLSEAAAWVAP